MKFQYEIKCTSCKRKRNPKRDTNEYKTGDTMPYACNQCLGYTDHEVIYASKTKM